MRLLTVAAALLVPFALADDLTTTTTITSYTTLTKTILITPTPGGHYNGTGPSNPTATATSKPATEATTSGGMSLDAAQYALLSVAGMIVVACL